MRPSRTKAFCGTLAALVLIALTLPAPASSQVQQPLEVSPASVPPAAAASAAAPAMKLAAEPVGAATESNAAAEPAAAASPAAKKTLRQKVKAALTKINPVRAYRDHQYRKAAATFAAFCKDWEQKLHEREKFNLTRVLWKLKDGYATGEYTGYSSVETCTTKESAQGFALGKLTYEEVKYYIVGKSQNEALHAKPRPIEDVHTTEIFRWDRGKWFY
jgi:hypothetical protein